MSQLNPIQWAVAPLKKYAVFSGRAPRAEYWWYALAWGTAGFLLGLLDVLVIGPPVVGGYGPFGLAFLLVMVTPGFAVTVRRLHDSGRSGWWCLMRLAGVVIGLIGPSRIKEIESLGQPWIGLAIVALLVWLFLAIALFVFLVTPGTEGANAYGGDPYGPDELEAVFA